MAVIEGVCRIVGGVDTHRIFTSQRSSTNRIGSIGTRSFATTRQGYRQVLAWMRSFGVLQRIRIESTGSYGAGLLRFMQQAKVHGPPRSRLRTSRIGVDVARTTISTRRTPPMPPLQASGP